MGWQIRISDEAKKDYRRLDSSIRKHVLAGIYKVSQAPLPSPNGYGKPLGNKNSNNLTGFKKEYDNLQPEFDVIRAIVDARTSQNLTQKQLAEKTGINQADISKLENGTRNPSINLLKRLADGMGMMLKIEFVPKQKV